MSTIQQYLKTAHVEKRAARAHYERRLVKASHTGRAVYGLSRVEGTAKDGHIRKRRHI